MYSKKHYFEILYRIIWTLTVGKGDVRSRLRTCHGDVMLLLIEKDLPKNVNIKVRKIEKEMNRIPIGDDKSLKKIYNKTASKLALELFEIYHEMIFDN